MVLFQSIPPISYDGLETQPCFCCFTSPKVAFQSARHEKPDIHTLPYLAMAYPRYEIQDSELLSPEESSVSKSNIEPPIPSTEPLPNRTGAAEDQDQDQNQDQDQDAGLCETPPLPRSRDDGTLLTTDGAHPDTETTNTNTNINISIDIAANANTISSKIGGTSINLEADSTTTSTSTSDHDHDHDTLDTTSSPSTSPSSSSSSASSHGGWYFFKFPAEIRNMIYDHALHYPTGRELYRGYDRKLDEWRESRRTPSLINDTGSECSCDCDHCRPASEDGGDDDRSHCSSYGHRQDHDDHNEEVNNPSAIPPGRRAIRFQTPTILLLCRKITAESLPMLRARPFIIDRLPPFVSTPNAIRNPLVLSDFMGRQTLQSLRHIELRVPFGQGDQGSGWAWTPIINDLFEILEEKNSFNVLLVSSIIFKHIEVLEGGSEWRHFRNLNNKIETLLLFNPRYWNPGKICREFWVSNSPLESAFSHTRVAPDGNTFGFYPLS